MPALCSLYHSLSLSLGEITHVAWGSIDKLLGILVCSCWFVGRLQFRGMCVVGMCRHARRVFVSFGGHYRLHIIYVGIVNRTSSRQQPVVNFGILNVPKTQTHFRIPHQARTNCICKSLSLRLGDGERWGFRSHQLMSKAYMI